MKHITRIGLLVAFVLAAPARSSVAADAPNVDALLDKAIHALGGTTNLSKGRGIFWKTKGQLSLNGVDNPFTGQTTIKDLRHARIEFEGDFGGNQVRGETVVDGDTGWREISGNRTDLDRDGLANELRSLYLQVLPVVLLPLKDKNSGFKIESASPAKLGDRSVVDLEIVPKEGKKFTLTLDAESALPLRTVAKVLDWTGNEVTQEVSYEAYKEMGGIKKATKLRYKRDGERLMDVEIVEFKFQS
ncbi:MAG: hypothetical protein JNL97_12445 [Verrucomicrobiales bacterium]|nr:hypothetical protein [Verrucomicrobiales bacterium]